MCVRERKRKRKRKSIRHHTIDYVTIVFRVMETTAFFKKRRKDLLIASVLPRFFTGLLIQKTHLFILAEI